MKVTTDEHGVVTGVLTGRKRSGATSNDEVLEIRKFGKKISVESWSSDPDSEKVTLNRDKFLKMISGVLNVYIEDTVKPNHGKWWVNGKQYPN